MKKYNRITSAVLVAFLAGGLLGCGSADAASGSAAKENTAEKESASGDSADNVPADEYDGEVTTVKIAVPGIFKIYQCYDESIQDFSGYEIEALRLIDERLPQYEFEFEQVESEAVFAGLSSGKYDIGLYCAFKTPERAESFNLPENSYGAFTLGVIFGKDKEEELHSLSDIAERNLRLAPVKANVGTYFVYTEYDNKNPDNRLNYELADTELSTADAVQAILEGRYDVAACGYANWNDLFVAEDGALHDKLDDIGYLSIANLPIYPLIAKEEPELCDAIDEVIGELTEEGVLAELSNKIMGFNFFETEDYIN